MGDLDLVTFLLALLAGAVRVGTPFLFVSLGECLTEKVAGSTWVWKAFWWPGR